MIRELENYIALKVKVAKLFLLFDSCQHPLYRVIEHKMKADKKLDIFVDTVNQELFKLQNYTLNKTEITILRGIWKFQTYNQIAREKGYSSSYLTNVAAPELCRKLSNLIGRRVTKKNCRVLVEFYATQQISQKATGSPYKTVELERIDGSCIS